MPGDPLADNIVPATMGGANAVPTIRRLLSVVAALSALMPMTISAEPIGRITGIGGIFFKSKAPKALIAWYRDVLGLKVEAWGRSRAAL